MGPAYHKGVPLLGVPGITLDSGLIPKPSTHETIEVQVDYLFLEDGLP